MKFTLIAKKLEVPGVESFIFKTGEPLAWKAGQYAHYILPHEPIDDRGTERWFTIASAPYEGEVMITTRLAAEHGSTFKKALAALEVGGMLESDYVDGDFVIEDTAKEYVLIAGGIGITPFHSILKERDTSGDRLHATMLYANRDNNFAFKEELDTWAKNNPQLAIHYIVDPEHLDEEAIRTYVPDIQKPLFYLSGPEPMVKNLEAMLESMGVPSDHIKIDDFPGYPTY